MLFTVYTKTVLHELFNFNKKIRQIYITFIILTYHEFKGEHNSSRAAAEAELHAKNEEDDFPTTIKDLLSLYAVPQL